MILALNLKPPSIIILNLKIKSQSLITVFYIKKSHLNEHMIIKTKLINILRRYLFLVIFLNSVFEEKNNKSMSVF